MNEKKYFILFDCCRIVRGAQRSLISDVQRGRYAFIPNILYDILRTFNGKSLYEVKTHYEHEYDEIIDQYFEFLYHNEYVFFTNAPHAFPPIKLDYETASIIENAIIDINEESDYDFQDVFVQLDSLRCNTIQLRSFGGVQQEKINALLASTKGSGIRIIELLIQYSPSTTESQLRDICEKYPRITNLFVYSADYNKVVNINYKTDIYLSTIEIKDEHCCGLILPLHFSNSLETYLESQKHNTCLNKKISIDSKGNIKNCPSISESYGNIKDTTLKEALVKPGFKKYWNITKDQVSVCKDCEFRYICTDCRAYLEDPEDIYSKPLKCGYNPYTCEWEEWSAHELKQKAISYYENR